MILNSVEGTILKKLHYISKNKLEWREVPDPVFQSAKEAIVQPIVAGRCDGDMVCLAHNYTLPIKAGVAFRTALLGNLALSHNPFFFFFKVLCSLAL